MSTRFEHSRCVHAPNGWVEPFPGGRCVNEVETGIDGLWLPSLEGGVDHRDAWKGREVPARLFCQCRAELQRSHREAETGKQERGLAWAAADFEQLGRPLDACQIEEIGVELLRVVGPCVLVTR